ncbi:hypothetical protein PHLH8_08130 [Pseudomonas sp. Pc102]|nr:hypothetical protein PHLH8_08130 [Pseudomonas sp. Pc102]
MLRLALLNPYPLHDGVVSQHDLAIHAMAVAQGWPGISLRQTNHARSPWEFARFAAESGGANNGFTMELERFLRSSSVYKTWRDAMPPLYRSPAINHYRDHRIKSTLLEELGILPTLSPGQYLFHGGMWPGSLFAGSKIWVDRPFSTTLSANPAVVHAAKDQGFGKGHVWVIEIGPSFNKPVYAYNLSQRRYKQEFEVLISPGFSAECLGFEDCGNYTLISVLLS